MIRGRIRSALTFYFLRSGVTTMNDMSEIKSLAHQLLEPFSKYKEHLQNDLKAGIMRLSDEKIKECKVKYFYLEEIEQQLKNIVNE